jgi:hypothetical protein
MAAITIAEQRTAIIALMETVTTVVKGFPYRPEIALQPSEIVAAICDPFAAPYNRTADGANALAQERDWDLLFIIGELDPVFRFEQQKTWDETQASAIEVLAPYKQVYLTDGRGFRMTLLNDGGPSDAEWIGDKRYRVLRIRARTRIDYDYPPKTRPGV